jgi:hypothetical protein
MLGPAKLGPEAEGGRGGRACRPGANAAGRARQGHVDTTLQSGRPKALTYIKLVAGRAQKRSPAGAGF